MRMSAALGMPAAALMQLCCPHSGAHLLLCPVAHTSKEFHERASNMRLQVQHLVMQPGLGYSAMVGMVKSHGAAAVVDLSKLEKHISRRNPEELVPQVGTGVSL